MENIILRTDQMIELFKSDTMKEHKNIRITLLMLLTIALVIGGTYWYEKVDEEEEINGLSLYNLPDNFLGKPLNQEDSVFLHYQDEENQYQDTIRMLVQNPLLPLKASILIEKDSLQITLEEERKKHRKISTHHVVLKHGQHLVSAQLADLNQNKLPELYLFIHDKKSMKLIAFEIREKQVIHFQLPPLMGRQAFGYASNDSIYLNENKIIRRFQFAKAQFTEFPDGHRFCEYVLDASLHFTLTSALDRE